MYPVIQIQLVQPVCLQLRGTYWSNLFCDKKSAVAILMEWIMEDNIIEELFMTGHSFFKGEVRYVVRVLSLVLMLSQDAREC